MRLTETYKQASDLFHSKMFVVLEWCYEFSKAHKKMTTAIVAFWIGEQFFIIYDFKEFVVLYWKWLRVVWMFF